MLLIHKLPREVRLARVFAIAAHGQQLYGDVPYVRHLDDVVAILSDYGPLAMVVGYLHDVVEDTDKTIDDIAQEFGDEVARYVEIVTDPSGKNRKERKEALCRRLHELDAVAHLALIVKAADRLANLRKAVEGDADGLLKMYRREHPAFRAAAHRSKLCDSIWDEMDEILEVQRG